MAPDAGVASRLDDATPVGRDPRRAHPPRRAGVAGTVSGKLSRVPQSCRGRRRRARRRCSRSTSTRSPTAHASRSPATAPTAPTCRPASGRCARRSRRWAALRRLHLGGDRHARRPEAHPAADGQALQETARQEEERPRAVSANINPRDGRAYPGEAYGIERFSVTSANADFLRPGQRPPGHADHRPADQAGVRVLARRVRAGVTRSSDELALQRRSSTSILPLARRAGTRDRPRDPDPAAALEDRPGTPKRLALVVLAGRREDRGATVRPPRARDAAERLLRQRGAPRQARPARPPHLRPFPPRVAPAPHRGPSRAAAALAAGPHRRDQRLHGVVLGRGRRRSCPASARPGAAPCASTPRRTRARAPPRRPTARRRAATAPSPPTIRQHRRHDRGRVRRRGCALDGTGHIDLTPGLHQPGHRAARRAQPGLRRRVHRHSAPRSSRSRGPAAPGAAGTSPFPVFSPVGEHRGARATRQPRSRSTDVAVGADAADALRLRLHDTLEPEPGLEAILQATDAAVKPLARIADQQRSPKCCTHSSTWPASASVTIAARPRRCRGSARSSRLARCAG